MLEKTQLLNLLMVANAYLFIYFFVQVDALTTLTTTRVFVILGLREETATLISIFASHLPVSMVGSRLIKVPRNSFMNEKISLLVFGNKFNTK